MENLIENDEMLVDAVLQGSSIYIITIDCVFFVSLYCDDSSVVLCVSGRSTIEEVIDVIDTMNASDF